MHDDVHGSFATQERLRGGRPKFRIQGKKVSEIFLGARPPCPHGDDAERLPFPNRVDLFLREERCVPQKCTESNREHERNPSRVFHGSTPFLCGLMNYERTKGTLLSFYHEQHKKSNIYEKGIRGRPILSVRMRRRGRKNRVHFFVSRPVLR